MKYKTAKNPSRNKLPIERGYLMEARKLKQERPELSLYECKLKVLNLFEQEVVLTQADKDWLQERRSILVSDKFLSKKRSTLRDFGKSLKGDPLERLVDDLIKDQDKRK